MVEVIRSTGVEKLPSGLVGRLSGYLDGRGYGVNTIQFLVRVLSRFQDWLTGEALTLADVDWLVVDRFVASSKLAGHRQPGSRKGMVPLVGFLVADGVVPPERFMVAPPEAGSPGEIAEQFIGYMVSVRGMAVSTRGSYRSLALAFLRSLAPAGLVTWGLVTVQSLQGFLTGWAATRCVHSVQLMASVMRAVLKFAFVRSLTTSDLSYRVGKVASKSLTGIVEGVPRADMDRLVSSIDVAAPLGVRDRAVIVMLTRLGLRAGEVARLRLDDIDWRAGVIMLRDPKSRKDVSVPIPVDVGAALVAYLKTRGDGGGCRAVFLRGHAPIGPLTVGGVSNIVFDRAAKAGLGTIRARRLRHGAAMAVIADGGTLIEAGQLLGHVRPVTTAVYAKTDTQSLRCLAVEWPVAS